MNHILYFIIIYLTSLIKNTSNEKIVFAWQMHRHGTRAPIFGIINGTDIYQEKWDKLPGELTETGKRMLYLLGVKSRKRYIEQFNLLSKNYNPQEIYIRSTDVNRTIESVESYLQGLYPPGSGPTIKENVRNDINRSYPPNIKYKEKFESIINFYNLNNTGMALPYGISIEPIHLFYKPRHEFQLYDTNICTGHKEKYEQQKNSKIIRDFSNKFLEDFGYMLYDIEDTNNKTFLYDYWTNYNYTDGFVCDEAEAKKFNLLVEQYGFEIYKFDLFRNYSKEFIWLDYYYTTYPEGYYNISIVANTHTMRSIVNWMEKAIDGFEKKENYLKFVIYSAHDSSIAALEHYMEYAFGTSIEFCDFGESRFFELYLDEENIYKVRYLKGDITEKINMDFNKFKEIINKKTWNEDKINEFCQFDNNHQEKEKNKEQKKEGNTLYIVIIIILIIINIIFFILIILIYFRK